MPALPENYKLTVTPDEYDTIIDALTKAPLSWMYVNSVILKINSQRTIQNRVHQENLVKAAEREAKAKVEADKKIEEARVKKAGKKGGKRK